ncbi:phage integrase family protein [Corallococcus macrosporus]|uniref:Phage integrase family protein n=1 Tax=Myxococcus fulvus (strain ATCC BAA-855 / HW-1) TaxID=483219 RepID=F8CRB1_MYXFH|nr:phage integrase family protein [Corallococcus macrosporus]AEI64255.1 phage integrase family protein [Corallococcus macrosporus]
MAPTKKPREPAAQGKLELTEAPPLAEMVGWYERTILAHKPRDTQKTVRQVVRAAVAGLPERPTAGDISDWLSERVRKGGIMASTANLHRRRLNRVYVLAHQLRWPLLLNPLAKVPVLQTAPQSPKGLADPYTTYPLVLAAMPDARSKAFVSMLRWHGLRESEALGLEPRHINWSAGMVRVEQQRKPWRGFVQGLKHDTCAATFY